MNYHSRSIYAIVLIVLLLQLAKQGQYAYIFFAPFVVLALVIRINLAVTLNSQGSHYVCKWCNTAIGEYNDAILNDGDCIPNVYSKWFS